MQLEQERSASEEVIVYEQNAGETCEEQPHDDKSTTANKYIKKGNDKGLILVKNEIEKQTNNNKQDIIRLYRHRTYTRLINEWINKKEEQENNNNKIKSNKQVKKNTKCSIDRYNHPQEQEQEKKEQQQHHPKQPQSLVRRLFYRSDSENNNIAKQRTNSEILHQQQYHPSNNIRKQRSGSEILQKTHHQNKEVINHDAVRAYALRILEMADDQLDDSASTSSAIIPTNISIKEEGDEKLNDEGDGVYWF